MMHINALYRYPVKGLSGEQLKHAALEAEAYFPGDRLFAIENGPSGFDETAPEHQPKIKFLMLMRNERLAKLETRFEDANQTLTILRDGKQVTRGALSRPLGCSIIEQFLAAFMKDELRGTPKVRHAPENFRFTDSRKGFVSCINLASVRDLGRVLGVEIDPLRFRGNILLEGLEPWQEFDFIGKSLKIGSVELEVTKRIERCAATNVNPANATRDMNIPNTLMRAFGHTDCGIYARITKSGQIGLQDNVELV
eukprot:gene14311-14434_t